MRKISGRVNTRNKDAANIAGDVSERDKANRALLESEKKYEFLVNNSEDFVFVISKTGRTIFANRRALAKIGYTQKEVIGKSIISFLAKGSVKKALYALAQEFFGHSQEEFNVDFKTKSGETRTLEISKGSVFVHEKGKLIGILISAHDITEREKVADALRLKEHLFRTTLESTAEGILVIDEKGKVAYNNSRFAEMWDIPVKLIEKRNDSLLLAHVLKQLKDPESFLSKVKKLYKSDKEDFDTLLFKDGRVFERHSRALISDDRIAGRIWDFRDVTERRNAEEALREFEEKFRTQFDAALDAIFIADAKTGLLVDCNPAACELVERKKSELIGKPQSILHPPSDIKGKFSRTFKQHLKEKKGQSLEARIITKKGEIKNVAIMAIIFKIKGKNFLQGIFRDITDEKKIIDRVKESEKRYRTLFDSSMDALMILEPPDWKFTSGNNATVKMFRAKDEKQFVSFGPWDVSPEHQPDGQLSSVKAKNMIMKAVKEGSNFFEWTHKRYKGEDFPATVLLTRIELNGKQVLQATVRDITEQKKTEEKILQTNAFNSSIVENAPFGVMIINFNGEIDYVNPALLLISGSSVNNFREMNVFKLTTYIKNGLSAKIKSCFKGKSFFVGSLEYISHFSKKKTVRNFTGIPMLSEQNDIEQVMLFIEDITAQKQGEQKLIESENKFKLQVHEMEILNNIILAGNQAEDLQSLLKNILEYSLGFINFDGGGIYLRDINGDIAKLQCSKNLSADFVKAVREVDVRKKPFSTVFLKKEAIYANDYSSYHPAVARRFGIASLASIPLLSKDEVIGALNIMSKKRHEFSESERHILESISVSVGTSIVNKLAEENLKSRTSELEQFNRMTVGRELKMVELKKRIADLENKEHKLGKNSRKRLEVDENEEKNEK